VALGVQFNPEPVLGALTELKWHAVLDLLSRRRVALERTLYDLSTRGYAGHIEMREGLRSFLE
jgi:hypothetical protein